MNELPREVLVDFLTAAETEIGEAHFIIEDLLSILDVYERFFLDAVSNGGAPIRDLLTEEDREIYDAFFRKYNLEECSDCASCACEPVGLDAVL